ncbi:MULTISPECIES: class I SAM-dependent methyltransferase [unclassified Leisingera]|uniref:class I SAM-dependent methyltransferase n=1 Tax=unclassified Leisingera TaxID=2614906 RepID=UPI00069160ED|nr:MULTISPECIES: class I SAM-dependent methyltransferase [unclassified Leisingera]
MTIDTKDYWDAYYGKKERPAVPSQFAAFVLNEFSDRQRFVDLGCGDGRDSFFFAMHGKSVRGIDGSASAVSLCQAVAERRGVDNIGFSQLDMQDAAACSSFLEQNAADWGDAIVYARFFLHAIDEDAEANLLRLAAGLVGDRGRLCLEFRTPRDQFQTKVTSEHYRRYVEPLQVIASAGRHGLTCTYLAEGFGFAKYKADDAFVARMVLERQ